MLTTLPRPPSPERTSNLTTTHPYCRKSSCPEAQLRLLYLRCSLLFVLDARFIDPSSAPTPASQPTQRAGQTGSTGRYRCSRSLAHDRTLARPFPFSCDDIRIAPLHPCYAHPLSQQRGTPPPLQSDAHDILSCAPSSPVAEPPDLSNLAFDGAYCVFRIVPFTPRAAGLGRIHGGPGGALCLCLLASLPAKARCCMQVVRAGPWKRPPADSSQTPLSALAPQLLHLKFDSSPRVPPPRSSRRLYLSPAPCDSTMLTSAEALSLH